MRFHPQGCEGETGLRRTAVVACLSLVLLWLAGCGWLTGLVGTKVIVRSSARSLQDQVLGAYDQVAEEVMVLASVRSVDPLTGEVKAAPAMSPSEARAVAARQSMEFHRDDILAFKREGFVGEGNDATLVFFPQEQERLRREDPWLFSLVEDLTRQENEDRHAVALRILEITPSLSGEEGMTSLRGILANKYRTEAEPGTRIQDDTGNWTAK